MGTCFVKGTHFSRGYNCDLQRPGANSPLEVLNVEDHKLLQVVCSSVEHWLQDLYAQLHTTIRITHILCLCTTKLDNQKLSFLTISSTKISL
jgi:hypothetical protein